MVVALPNRAADDRFALNKYSCSNEHFVDDFWVNKIHGIVSSYGVESVLYKSSMTLFELIVDVRPIILIV